jgi:acyl dehydratase
MTIADAPPDVLHLEDFTVGRIFSFGRYEVTKEEIIEFASEFDAQPHHLDEEAAKTSMLGGLAASGWHTCGMTMRMVAEDLLNKSANRGGIGADECRWMKPVKPGDVLRVEAEVLEARVAKNMPDVGFVRLACRVFNQREQVMLINMTPIIARRAT